MDYKDKAESLANRMNALSEKFELSEEMLVEGDDIIEYVEEKTEEVKLFTEESKENQELLAAEIINLDTMVNDFQYVRETLRETTDNGRRVLNIVTLDLIDADEESRASLISSFAELNSAVGNNMKLYMQSYKDISAVLLNIDKIKKNSQKDSPHTVNNTVNVHSTEAISTTDLIQRLAEIKES